LLNRSRAEGEAREQSAAERLIVRDLMPWNIQRLGRLSWYANWTVALQVYEPYQLVSESVSFSWAHDHRSHRTIGSELDRASDGR